MNTIVVFDIIGYLKYKGNEMKNLSLGLKLGVTLLMSGILGTSVMAEGQKFENPIIAKPAPKKFEDPAFKKEDLKKPVVDPRK